MSAVLDRAHRCPFCTGVKLWLWDKAVPGKVAVACSYPHCAATGPLADNPEAAVVKWNLAPRRGYSVPVDQQRLNRVLVEAGRDQG